MDIGSIALGCLVVIFLIGRQLQERPVKEDRSFRMMLILIVLGAAEVSDYVHTKGVVVPTVAYVYLGISLAIGAVLGYFRAQTAHIWRDHGRLVSKGTWVTLVLWVVGIGLHLGSEPLISHVAPHASQLGDDSLLIYIGISLLVQQLVTTERAKTATERSPASPIS